MTITQISDVTIDGYQILENIEGQYQVVETATDASSVVEVPSVLATAIENTIPPAYAVEVSTGPTGHTPMLYTGTGPDSDTGVSGDLYLVTSGGSLGDLYARTIGGWGTPVGNIRGPQGINGVINTINGLTGTNVTLSASDITTGVFALAQLPTGTSGAQVALGNHNHDSAYVGLSGAQTIAGAKTFSDSVVAGGGSGALIGAAGLTSLGTGDFAVTVAETLVLESDEVTVSGVLRLSGGLQVGSTATAGHVLTTDASGNATWQPGQDLIPTGTTAQYYRGDKTWATLNKSAVGLSAVDNTADADKPVSSATQTALNLKANLASPTFTGTVTGTFAGNGAALTDIPSSAIASGVLNIARIPTGTTGSTVALGNHTHSDYVALTGNQTIAGTKTFSSAPSVPDGSFTVAKTLGLTTSLAEKAPINNAALTGTLSHSGSTSAVFSTSSSSVLAAGASVEVRADSGTPAIHFAKTSPATSRKLQVNPSNGRFEFTASNGSTMVDVQALEFYGSGANITSLDAAQLSTGTVPQARLGANMRRVVVSTGSEARPTTATYVEWIGPVEPVNAQANDTWVNTGD